MNIFSRYPFFFLLIPLYPVLVLFNNNFENVQFESVWRILTIVFLIGTLLFFLNISLNKIIPRFKFSYYAFFLLILIFTYGIQYEVAEKLYYKGLWPFKNIHRYLLIFNVLFLTLSSFYFQKKNISMPIFYKSINIFFSILITLNLIQIVYKSILLTNKLTKIQKRNLAFHSPDQKPDIIYILLDGYASDGVLKKFYRYDNSEFKKKLSEMGFTNYSNVITYYYGTFESLSAIFNLNFLENDSVKKYDLKNNFLFQYLNNYGYCIKYFESGYSVTSKFTLAQKIFTSGINEFERTYLRLTLFRYDDLLGEIAYKRIKDQLKELEYIEKHLTSSPDFIFSHIVCPHPPFVFDKFGNRKRKFINRENFWEPSSDFVEQTIAINHFLLPILKKLSSLNNTIIILQSDHGPWLSSNNMDDVLNVRESVLTCIKWNKKIPNEALLHTINTFRLLIKTEMDPNIPLLDHQDKNLEKFKNYTQLIGILNKQNE